MFSERFEQLVQALRILPSVGPKSAQRMALHLLMKNREGAFALSYALHEASSHIHECHICHSLTETLENVSYFPAYEIMMDDLRDYRFYEKDLIHPNEIAIDYIWEKFSNLFFDLNTQNLNSKIVKVLTALNHKTRNIDSLQHQAFLIQIEEEINILKYSFPHFSF